MFGKYVDFVRSGHPLIHCITNYVTVNDCANALLFAGASPIMADAPEEAAEISALCSGVCLNIGTLNSRTIESMLVAGMTANRLKRPVTLDPVGAGASAFRTGTAKRLLDELDISVLRGNISEIMALAGTGTSSRGVDASPLDRVGEDNLDAAVDFVRGFAAGLRCVVSISGAIDLVSDGERCCVIRNGYPAMPRITGSGCMLSALTAAFTAASPGAVFEAACAAVCFMGWCGETAAVEAEKHGLSSFRNGMLDAMSRIDGQSLDIGAKYEFR